MNRKKTLYEILAVPPDASADAIAAAFRARMAELDARPPADSADTEIARKVLRVALTTLSDPGSRAAYDAKLRLQAEGEPPSPAAALALVPLPEATPPHDPHALQAEVLSLRADALALRADALAARARAGAPPLGLEPLRKGLSGTVRAVLIALGTLMAASLVFQVLMGGSRRGATPDAAAEKVMLQEFYQTHGVRAASRAEAELLEAELRRKENEARRAEQETQRAEEERRRAQDEERRWLERAGEQVRQSEENARLAGEREAQQIEYEQARRREAEQRQAEAERWRIEREQQKWQEVLRR